MPLQSVESRRRQLEALMRRIAGTHDDPELQAHFARYVCVVISGFVEQATKEMLSAYAIGQSSPNVARYVSRTVERQNLNANNLLQLIEHFDANWRAQLETYIEGERKSALDSIVNHRHAVAHGRPTSISYHQLSAYYTNVMEIVTFVEALCAV